MKKRLLLTLLTLTSQWVQAGPITSIPDVGNHYRLFLFEKNENPENIMVLYTQLNSQCEIQTHGGQPVFDSYWLMNREAYKPVHPLIKKGIKDRLEVKRTSDPHSFFVALNDLKEVDSDITDPRLQIIASPNDEHDCAVAAFITLGKSNDQARIRLTSIYSQTEKTFLPPFRRLVSVTLTGTEVQTGQKISRKYMGKK